MGSFALYSRTKTPPSALTSLSQPFMNSMMPGPQSLEKRPVPATVPPILTRSGRWASAGSARESPRPSASRMARNRLDPIMCRPPASRCSVGSRRCAAHLLLPRPSLQPDRPVHGQKAGAGQHEHQGQHREGERELQPRLAPEEAVGHVHLEDRHRHVDDETRGPEARQETEENTETAEKLGDGHDPGPEDARFKPELGKVRRQAGDAGAPECSEELLRAVHHEDEAEKELQDQHRPPLQSLESL